ncbi:hypothetical protein TPHA_0C03100 [Tetrapisispora phaffii CBS 4417]|uniref:Major facilitator superfamily (MFS) profile domain-containing protein n=1 Tax=Tetrapisispora phaffii (strain ATCC 24235 / CBS 4417 / NBRC 1672 / NRRL Y-8282 / UCD 70-5) TaxID=1071381 RepID=G8BRT7_TETPH|nr:hypothetical protein TPHA_0C03100 [Tetrapisispora phaffii CBS 4417]CCE62463.1 hypothetical protein TPHA_0C03100 [Tetrapisispora phaffii CBS 4417]
MTKLENTNKSRSDLLPSNDIYNMNNNNETKGSLHSHSETTKILQDSNIDEHEDINSIFGNNDSYENETMSHVNTNASDSNYMMELGDVSDQSSDKSNKNLNNKIDELDENSPPHSRFTRNDKIMLIAQCAFTGFFSSIAGAIYYPVLTLIEGLFKITEEQANISVVVYFIFQGIAPIIVGNLADTNGRRPLILSCLLIYFCACVGLASCNTYAQLIGLRCLQAAGIAPVIAINSGIAGDITTRRERGSYIGYVSGFVVIGSAFGALIGAGLSSTWDWRAIFWFLAIGSGVCVIYSIILFPETKRSIVGNGSIAPKSILNKCVILSIPAVRRKWHLDKPEYNTLEPPKKSKAFPIFEILKHKEMIILLIVAGLQFSMWTTHQTSLTTVLSKRYNLTVAKIGLCFLPTGICTMISVITCGKFLNYAYKKDIAKYELWIKDQREILLQENNEDEDKVDEIIFNDPKYTFNICRSRLKPAFVTLFLSSCGFIAFGWCIEKRVPLAAVLVTSGFSSLFSNCILTMSTTVCVDLFPSISTTATGCLNLFRCSMSAILIACLSKMVSKMNYGGVFTFLGALTGVSSFLLLITVRNGKELTFYRNKLNYN